MHVVLIGAFNAINRIFEPWMSQDLRDRDTLLWDDDQ